MGASINKATVKLAMSRVPSSQGFHFNDSTFEILRDTLSQEDIIKAVYSDDPYLVSCIVRNPNLSSKHCRHILRKHKDILDDLSFFFLILQDKFPTELLIHVAYLSGLGSLSKAAIRSKPNLPQEVKIILALN